MNLTNDVIETLRPVLARVEQQTNQTREQSAEEREKLKSEISRLTTENQKLNRRAELLENATDADLRNAACAGLALAALDTAKFNLPPDVVDGYLRSRGWRRVPSGWIAPTGGGELPTATAVRLAAGEDLKAVLPSLRQHLTDAAKAALKPEPVGV